MQKQHLLPTRFTMTLALGVLLAACADQQPFPAEPDAASMPSFAAATADANMAMATLRRVTAKYQDLATALDDDFVLLHPCEDRPGEGPVGTVYVNFARLLDGVIDPELPDALIYEPTRTGEKLVGVELAIPYAMAGNQPPTFMGAVFQSEDEFGVFALHAWVWRENPEGMFAETNPRVTCGG